MLSRLIESLVIAGWNCYRHGQCRAHDAISPATPQTTEGVFLGHTIPFAGELSEAISVPQSRSLPGWF